MNTLVNFRHVLATCINLPEISESILYAADTATLEEIGCAYENCWVNIDMAQQHAVLLALDGCNGNVKIEASVTIHETVVFEWLTAPKGFTDDGSVSGEISETDGLTSLAGLPFESGMADGKLFLRHVGRITL